MNALLLSLDLLVGSIRQDADGLYCVDLKTTDALGNHMYAYHACEGEVINYLNTGVWEYNEEWCTPGELDQDFAEGSDAPIHP